MEKKRRKKYDNYSDEGVCGAGPKYSICYFYDALPDLSYKPSVRQI